MAQRAERVRLDPQRDQARLLELRPFLDALAAANTAGIGGDPRWQALRWNIEELRVSLFAQSPGTRQPLSVKRLTRQLAQPTCASRPQGDRKSVVAGRRVSVRLERGGRRIIK